MHTNTARPFWKTGKCNREPFIFWENEINHGEGSLMFSPSGPVRIYDAYGAVLEEGRDYIREGRHIFRTDNSGAPLLTREEYMPLAPTKYSAAYGRNERQILYTEGDFLIDRQLYADYSFDPSMWPERSPVQRQSALCKTREYLEQRQNVRVALLGDSLGEGCNCTRMLGRYPYADPWYIQFVSKLIQKYHAPVELPGNCNLSKGCMLSDYGVEKAPEAAELNADLVIIEFGGNDGTFHVEPEKYQKNVKMMMDIILNKNPDSEFILCSPLLANPDSIQRGIQAEYLDPLLELSKEYPCAVADFLSMHTAMLSGGKRYSDFSANNINHPNDFLIEAMAYRLFEIFD